MRRDLELLRDLMLHIEREDSYTTGGLTFDGSLIPFGEHSAEVMLHHVTLLEEGGLISLPRGVHHDEEYLVLQARLTWEGHEFLEAARDDHRWQQARERLERVNSSNYSILKGQLLKLIEESLKE